MKHVEPSTQASEGTITANLELLVNRGQRFRCILADPPWQYDNHPRGAAEHHYRTMTLASIMALPVESLAENNAFLHLWCPHSFLREAHDVMRAWGFAYKSVFVWIKTQIGTGHYWRIATEFLLLGVRGKCRFLNKKTLNWLCLPRTRHSSKPREVRFLIEKTSPGPYLELFGRKAIAGWTVFSNEIERTMFDDGIIELK